MKRIRLHLESLALKGFRYADRYEVAAGLEAELGRLLADPATLRNLTAQGNVARLEVPNVRIAPGSTPRQIGASAARAIGERGKS